MIFMRSKGDTTVRDTAPATPPAMKEEMVGCPIKVRRLWNKVGEEGGEDVVDKRTEDEEEDEVEVEDEGEEVNAGWGVLSSDDSDDTDSLSTAAPDADTDTDTGAAGSTTEYAEVVVDIVEPKKKIHKKFIKASTTTFFASPFCNNHGITMCCIVVYRGTRSRKMGVV